MTTRSTPNLAERMDKQIASGSVKPMILVMPDCFTYYGGSQYINSTATGRYEDYLTQEIVQFVDENFRTLANRDSRAVMGKSSVVTDRSSWEFVTQTFSVSFARPPATHTSIIATRWIFRKHFDWSKAM
jgi:hypothetical protein